MREHHADRDSKVMCVAGSSSSDLRDTNATSVIAAPTSTQASSRVRVEIADGNALLAHSLSFFLSEECDIEVTGVRCELDLVNIKRTRPDVLVIGYFLMLTHGPEYFDELRRELANVKTLVLTATLDEETLASCVRFGTVGCVTKSQHPRDLAEAIRSVAGGSVLFEPEGLVRLLRAEARRAPVTDTVVQVLAPREIEVLAALAQGHNTVEIATQMVISPHTVRSHVRSALTKLGVRSRSEAIAVVVRRGLIGPLAERQTSP
jgi:DNA-binding NarL/FixJ family response regulator